jgi:hypothetical protein
VRAFPVRLPSGASYWTVLDEDLVVVQVADEFLRQVRSETRYYSQHPASRPVPLTVGPAGRAVP